MSKLHRALGDLVALVLRTGGYMSPEDQNVLWRARQALVDAETHPPRDLEQETV